MRHWNLERVLLWWSIFTAGFFVLSVLTPWTPFANAAIPQYRLSIGDARFGVEFVFALLAYVLITHGRIRASVIVVSTLIATKLIYGMAVVLFDDVSVVTTLIPLGEMAQCAVLGAFAIIEWKRDAQPNLVRADALERAAQHDVGQRDSRS